MTKNEYLKFLENSRDGGVVLSDIVKKLKAL